MKSLTHKTAATAAIVFSTLALTGQARADGLGDLMVYVENGKLVTGLYDFDGGSGLVTAPGPVFVYTTELEDNWEGGGMPGADEPGIATDNSAPADPDGQNFIFPANTALNVTANLLPVLGTNAAYWDGNGAVSFGATPHDLEIEDAFSSIALDGTGTAPVGTLTPWVSSPTGTSHDHLEFLLDEPDATASAGIYLFSLTFDTGNADASDPVYFVAGYGIEEPGLDIAIEAAEEWVEANIVPEPASLVLMSLGLTAFARRRQR